MDLSHLKSLIHQQTQKVKYISAQSMLQVNFHFRLKFFQPFKPQYQHTNSPNWSLYISLKNELREFDKRSKHFLFSDHVSHCQQQQSYSGLRSPRRSNSTYFWNDSWVQTFHSLITLSLDKVCTLWFNFILGLIFISLCFGVW